MGIKQPADAQARRVGGIRLSSRAVVAGGGRGRGRAVYYDAQLWYPPYFVSDPSFIDWYERWLGQALQGTDATAFGFDNQAYG